LLKPLADAITSILGDACEVVIHDFSNPDESIIHITGNVTGRKVGGPLTDLGLAILRQGQVPDTLIDYTTYTPDGRKLRSSTVFLKDEAGVPFGAICVNIDTTRPLAPSALAYGGMELDPLETFADSSTAVITRVFNTLVSRTGRPVRNMSRPEKIGLVYGLDRTGIFCLRKAADIVAELLGVTRATVYVYLKAATENTEADQVCDGTPE
jgi:predicted transcriptional regulator YheO